MPRQNYRETTKTIKLARNPWASMDQPPRCAQELVGHFLKFLDSLALQILRKCSSRPTTAAGTQTGRPALLLLRVLRFTSSSTLPLGWSSHRDHRQPPKLLCGTSVEDFSHCPPTPRSQKSGVLRFTSSSTWKRTPPRRAEEEIWPLGNGGSGPPRRLVARWRPAGRPDH